MRLPPTSSASPRPRSTASPARRGCPFGEELALEPVTPYGASKAAMEVLCGSYARGRGLRIATIRAFNQLGPGQSPVFAASGFARQIAAAEAAGAERVELAVGNLAAARDFTDVRDTARAFVAASQQRADRRLQPLLGRPAEAGGPGRGDGEGDAAAGGGRRPTLRSPAPPTHRSSTATPPASARRSAGRLEIPLSQSVADLLDWWRAELAAA